MMGDPHSSPRQKLAEHDVICGSL